MLLSDSSCQDLQTGVDQDPGKFICSNRMITGERFYYGTHSVESAKQHCFLNSP